MATLFRGEEDGNSTNRGWRKRFVVKSYGIADKCCAHDLKFLCRWIFIKSTGSQIVNFNVKCMNLCGMAGSSLSSLVPAWTFCVQADHPDYRLNGMDCPDWNAWQQSQIPLSCLCWPSLDTCWKLNGHPLNTLWTHAEHSMDFNFIPCHPLCTLQPFFHLNGLELLPTVQAGVSPAWSMPSRLESGWGQPVQPDSMLSRLEPVWNQPEIGVFTRFLPNISFNSLVSEKCTWAGWWA